MTEAIEQDRGFWRSAYQSHAPAVLAFLQHRLGRREDAEDLLQETFVRAIRSGSFDGNTGRVRPWAMRLAAALLLVAGLWGALAAVRSTLRPAGEPIEVTLGEDRGRMTEQRFLYLTVELLRADSRYHLEMLQVLTAVSKQSGEQETSADYDTPLPEGDDGEANDWRPAQRARRLS